MRVLQRNEGNGSGDVNISPLIDMVFILLIFFIVTTVFVDEKGMSIQTPTSLDSMPEATEPFLIQIKGNGAIYHKGEEQNFIQLKGVVSKERYGENRTVTLEVADSVSTARMISVMDFCMLSGAAGVSVRSSYNE